ncbi:50S ribosomal protein L32 [Tuanshanicoccus lijuaniae]|uniref:50S ribosomal protein L32 n=1 Tax=Aerococcaceae bacterium zg-1292 TaxID=2774330 RepID=UPI001936AF2A|nr:50S ribosomal protein L32 [Aerococcaceae bacterium zg-1292]MBF6625823.1 50S ribosomal protein L32 [Aerococcaceae bacterium zg-BR9]MBF6978616.1 50S ribosomal protein L32 [Aerococcaceae bacterium zg-BR22]MBS4455601.1 50S ribosomal protein L32 [Aerococcaceae bacterium zg-A91]MBS4457220.1 50S ribosomal protein L32 [Aerococcaceae bacterium zg-BR33]
MAVPKRKTSKAKKRSRRTHKGLSVPNISFDRTTGQWKVPHRIAEDGTYNGKNVMSDEA